MTNSIIMVASVVSAISVIATVIYTAFKIYRKFEKWQDTIDRHDHENYMNILRLVIMCDNMPLEERIKAGDDYLRCNGNGAVKHYYNNILLKKLEDKKS